MDRIANLIIQIKNAGNAGLSTISVPNSKLVSAVADVLAKHGYIKSVSKKGKKLIKTLEIEIAYTPEGKPRVTDVQRVSKLSRRMYGKAKEIRPVRSGFGMTVLSTPAGILTDFEARKANVGGEILFKIW